MTVSNNGDDASMNGSDDQLLAAGLHRARAAIDAEIGRSAAPKRVAAAVLAETVGPQPRFRWVAIAATMVVAAGLGGLYETSRIQGTGDLNVVVLDPLTFGAVAVDQ
jgi:hypothetical protein